MRKTIKIILTLIVTLTSVKAEFVFSHDDPTVGIKQQVLTELIAIMGAHGAATYVDQHEKVILWTNKAPVLKDRENGGFKDTTLPSFSTPEGSYKEQLKKIIFDQTGLDLPVEKIGGVLIANPYQAAIMYYKVGYMSKPPKTIDNRVSPAVIIYHEMAHAKDSLISPFTFSEMATSFDNRYKNHAERSAVWQQNDFIITSNSMGLNYGGLRQSYGENKLVMVESPWQVPTELNEDL